MAQTLSPDFPIDPVTTSGTQLADILNRLASSIDTTNSGATPPPDLSPGMMWLDTSSGTNGILRMRNAANSGWITIANTDDPPLSASAAVKKAGDTMTGALGLADGTVAAPGLAFASEAGLGWYRPAPGQIAIAVGGQQIEKLNTTASTTTLNLYSKSAGSASIQFTNQPSSSPNYNLLSVGMDQTGALFTAVSAGSATAKPMKFQGASGYTFDQGVTVSAPVTALTIPFANSFIGVLTRAPNDANQWHLAFQNAAGTVVGAIATTASSTAYNTASDYRLKKDVADFTDGLAAVLAMQPRRFKWIATDADDVGFIAHELAPVAPSAVTGEKDAVDADGNIRPQGVDTSYLVPYLVSAIKTLNERLTALGTHA